MTFRITYPKNKMCIVMDSCVFVRAGKHTSVHDVHPHSNGLICEHIVTAIRGTSETH